MQYLLSAIIGYLLGSIPAAYLIVKNQMGIDITSAGSGNVGAMNSFEVSNSKMLGALVLLIDALKGLISVYLTLLFFGPYFVFPALALLFAIVAHCYNPWLQFKGGRGLATAAGGALLLFPFLLVIWGVLWVMFYIIKRDILFANIAATPVSLIVTFLTADMAIKYTFPHPESGSALLLFSSAVLVTIFNRHIDPLKELLTSKNFSIIGKKNE